MHGNRPIRSKRRRTWFAAFVTPGNAPEELSVQTAVIFVPGWRVSLVLRQDAVGAARIAFRGGHSVCRRRTACLCAALRRFQAAVFFVPRRRISLSLGHVAVGAPLRGGLG